ncbi:MAG TPA: tRNA lysidine(34) synthetase TilS [Xanthomonadaceae bacterium]|nr:tRNA lysidine(34) synthetase TilS [Xanthomonadaceae bacterium]
MDLLPLPADAPHHLLLGFSGGRDSSVLLHRLAGWCATAGRRLRAVHVDHGLNPASGEWATHGVAAARALGVECAVHRTRVQRAGRGLEDAARRARYAAFAAERRADETLVLGHHRDDQIETLLLALLRGSGERGLSGMRAFTVDARGPIWRPLLDVPGETIAAYARAHGVRWIDDPANADLRLARNAIRREVLPLLRRHWPAVDAGLAHSARHLAEADALLRDQAARDLAPLRSTDGSTLALRGLHALPLERARRALCTWAESLGATPSHDALMRVFGGWRDAAPGRALRHALGPHWLRQWQGRLWVTPRDRSGAVAPAAVWDGHAALPLPAGGVLRLIGARGFAAPLRVVGRHAAPGRFRAAGDAHSRPLQAVFAALDVPPWARAGVPLLVDPSGELAAISDLAYGTTLGAWLRQRGARLLWQPGIARG